MMSVIKRLFLIGVLLPFISGLIFVFPWQRLLMYSPYHSAPGVLAIALFWILPTLFFTIWIKTRTPVSALLGLISVNWLGICLMFMWVSVFTEALGLIFTVPDSYSAMLILTGGLCLCLYAYYNAARLTIQRLKISSAKLTKPYKAVQLSDLHLGSRSQKFVSKAIKKANAQAPDMIFITGDLFDMSRVRPESLDVLKELNAPAYFITGNHDRYVGSAEHFDAIRLAGVVILDNRSVLHEAFQIIGIDDERFPDQLIRKLPCIEIQDAYFSILLYHKPENFSFVAARQVDLMLCGHTHAGQIFPFDLIVKKQFPHIKGLHKTDNSHLYVSQGTGTWGPVMRLGTVNEITVFDLVPAAGV